MPQAIDAQVGHISSFDKKCAVLKQSLLGLLENNLLTRPEPTHPV
jgi:hypothetical protein